jgi:hypothetical protein
VKKKIFFPLLLTLSGVFFLSQAFAVKKGCPVPIIYGLNESHSNDWAQCSSNGLIGISYFNKYNNTLYYKTIDPNGCTNEEVVTQGSHLEISVLLFDTSSNPHIFVATSSDIDQIITHFYKNDSNQWINQQIMHFKNEGGKHIYELSADTGPDNTFHLLVLKTRSNPDSEDYYWAFLNSSLYYLNNVEGDWHKNLIKNYNTIPTLDEYSKALNRQDLKIDRQGFVHIVFGEVPTNTFWPSRLCYTTNKPGYWRTEVASINTEGSADDGGLFPSLCLNSNGIPSISCTYVDRVSSGSAMQAKLLFLTRVDNDEWSCETVATNSDQYSGSDGNYYTGGSTNLVFDSNNVPHIVFTDIASSHVGLQYWNLGNIRYATKNGNTWSLSTIYTQPQPISNYKALEIYGLCLLVTDERIQVVGQELNLKSSTNYSLELVHKTIWSNPTQVKPITNDLALLNYPNPFENETSINFTLQNPSKVKVSVYNSMGNIIATLIDKTLPAGLQRLTFNPINLPCGIYILHCIVDNETFSKKIVRTI